MTLKEFDDFIISRTKQIVIKNGFLVDDKFVDDYINDEASEDHENYKVFDAVFNLLIFVSEKKHIDELAEASIHDFLKDAGIEHTEHIFKDIIQARSDIKKGTP